MTRSLFDLPRPTSPYPRFCGRPTRGWRWGAGAQPSRADVPDADGVPDVSLARARLELAEGDPEAALRELEAFRRADGSPFMPFAPAKRSPSRRSRGTRSGTRPPPWLPWSAALTSPSRAARAACCSATAPRCARCCGARSREAPRTARSRRSCSRRSTGSPPRRRGDPAPARAAQRAGAHRPALPADDALQRRDRLGDVRLAEHGQDAPQARLPQARRGGPQASGASRPGAPPAEPGLRAS